MNRRVRVLLLITGFICVQCLFAQKNTQNQEIIPLRELLSALELKHDVKFSYSDVLVNQKFCAGNYQQQELASTLKKLSLESNLLFEVLDARYIIVSEKPKIAGEVCGFVYDALTKAPVQGANVFPFTKNTGVSTRSNGFFRLSNMENESHLEVSFVGYESKLIQLSALKEGCLEIELRPQNTLLDEVLITDYMVGGIDKKSDGAIVISPKRLGTVAGLTEPDVLQSAQLLPGISSPNETASGLYIRGGTPEQNLILFDGIKMYNSSHFFGMLSAFNPYIINKVKIYKSGTSSEYGNHTSGVIDIETSKDIPTRVQGGFGVNMTHFDAFLNIPISKKVGLAISGRRSFTDVFKTSTFSRLSKKVFQNTIISRNEEAALDDFENKNSFYFADINSKLTLQASPKDLLVFNHLLVRNKLGYLFQTKTTDRYMTKDDLKIENSGFRLQWERNWSERTRQKTSLYSSNYDFSYKYNGRFNYSQAFTQAATKTNVIDDIGFKTAIEHDFGKYNSILTGYEFVNNDVRYLISRENSANSFKYTIQDRNINNTHALFFNYGFNRNAKTILNVGMRANYFSFVDKMYFAPRLYLQQEVLPNLSLKTSYEYKQQNIGQLIENHTSDFGLEDQVWLLVNGKELPVLRNSQYTLGLMYKNKGTIFDIDFFRKDSKGIASTIGPPGNTINLIGTGSVDGVDVLLKQTFGNYSSWMNYSYSKSRQLFDNFNRGNAFPSNFDVTNSFLWAHNLQLGDFSFSLAWMLRTGTPYTPLVGIGKDGTLFLGEINSQRLPRYHKLDFSTSYSFNFDSNKRWQGKIGLSLLNVYNKTNILSRKYSSVILNGNYVEQRIDNLSLGFTPNLVLRIFIK